uniref:Secreted protein n=1 Tax=Plectus sambesii TaxID=2011161 RepID=A0A914VK27_9BILA
MNTAPLFHPRLLTLPFLLRPIVFAPVLVPVGAMVTRSSRACARARWSLAGGAICPSVPTTAKTVGRSRNEAFRPCRHAKSDGVNLVKLSRQYVQGRNLRGHLQ